MVYKLRWTNEALRNLEDVIEDIRKKWTEKEVDNFKLKFSHNLELIVQNPYLFPVSSKMPGLRKSVLSKQTTIFYKVTNDVVFLTYIHFNKSAFGKERS